MSIFHILNVADFFFMAAGVGAALLMIVVGANGGDGLRDETDAAKGPSRRGRAE